MDKDRASEIVDKNDVRFISPYQRNQYEDSDTGIVVGSFFSVVFEVIKTVVIVGALALGLRIFVVQPFIVEGLSMYPTLDNNDYLLIDKISYRFHEPKRGDIIVFRFPLDEKYNYIKRVIGLPGERIRITRGAVMIFNKEHSDGFIIHESYVKDPEASNLNNDRTVIDIYIPEHRFFVMGDNRLGSSDSRDWGLLPEDDIIGRSFVLLFPISDFQFFKSPTY